MAGRQLLLASGDLERKSGQQFGDARVQLAEKGAGAGLPVRHGRGQAGVAVNSVVPQTVGLLQEPFGLHQESLDLRLIAHAWRFRRG